MTKIKLTFYGQVIDGALKLHKRELFQGHVLSLDGQRVELTLDRFKETRSDRQNRYYWGVVVPIFADFFGMSAEETHEYLKLEHLKIKIKGPDGNMRFTVRSTSGMKTDEFEEYTALLRRWGAQEFSLNIPEPNEVPWWNE